MKDGPDKIEEVTKGGVILGGGASPIQRLAPEVRQRFLQDANAFTLMAEARNMLWRASGLFMADTGYWEDEAANVEMASRIDIALKVLSTDAASVTLNEQQNQ